VPLILQKFKLIFTDGTTETIEAIGLWLAWFKGKLRAAEKGTVLWKVERAPTFSSPAGKRFHVKYIDLTTGRTEEKMIEEIEQYDLYKAQREGKISIISIKTLW